MSDLKQIEPEVLECLIVIKQHFHNEFNDINDQKCRAIINSDNEVIGIGVSHRSALTDAVQRFGSEVIKPIFINDLYTQARLTRSAFDILSDDVNAFSSFIKIGNDRISDVFMATINDAVNNLDRLLKRVDGDWSFMFIANDLINESGSSNKAFSFNLHADDEDMYGGYVKSDDMTQGPWVTVANDLSLIALGYKNAIVRQNSAKKRAA